MKKSALMVAAVFPVFCTISLAGTIRGTAYDADARVVPNARVLLMLDYVKQQEQRTSQSGEFRFDGVGPGRYEVQIKKEKTFIFQNTVMVEKPEQEVVIYALLPVARMIDVSVVSARLPKGIKRQIPPGPPVQPGGEVEVARPAQPLRVPYPQEAVNQGIEGKVALHVRINIDGTLNDPLVLSSPHELLTRAVVDSLAKARYRPMQLNGHPIACGMDVQVEFKLTEE